jgi:hypothetical protein
VLDPPILNAWADESARTQGVSRPAYILGAALADPAACDSMRAELLVLQPARRKKLHWRELDGRQRDRVVRTIASFNLHHVVVVGSPLDLARQERARALCLERLAWTLGEQHGVRLLTLEARAPSLMARDMRTVDALRGRRTLRPELRIEHGLPSEEPMLWIADQVLGAFGEWITGRSERFAALGDCVNVINIDV